MTNGMLTAYAIVAALLLFVSLASTQRPRSLALIGLAVALWPVTLIAITLQVFVSKAKQRQGIRGVPGLSSGRTAAAVHRTVNG